MNALKTLLQDKREQGMPALITYVTAGYPTLDDTIPILMAMQKGGVDVIELGIPFTDPMADGSEIQRSNEIALKNQVNYSVVLDQLRGARKKGLTVPVLLMGYYNPLFVYGESKAIEDASEAGANGFIVVDLPPEEGVEFRENCLKANLTYVPLIAPSTSVNRIRFLASIADTFIYIVSKMGTTGSFPDSEVSAELPEVISRVREHSTVPLAVGFGIATTQHFIKVADAGANAIVIGSQLVAIIRESPKGQIMQRVEMYCRDIGTSMDSAGRPHSPISVPHPSPLPALEERRANLPMRFGRFGGQYVSEALLGCLAELEQAYFTASLDPTFWKEFEGFYGYMNRPSQLYFANGLTKEGGGAGIWLKREDLNFTGSHKINNAVGQVLLARRIGKKRIIAETGAGQHGVAVATVCARFGMECVVYMGTEDIRRQAVNVTRMEMLGTRVVPVNSGTCTLKDAVNETLRDWVTNLATTHYTVGSAIGPHPFPTMVRDFQRVIGREIKEEFKATKGKLPDAIVACIGGGSNAIGSFYDFIEDKEVRLIGVEAGGEGIDTPNHSAALSAGRLGVLHGVQTYIVQNSAGHISEGYSISVGLGYPSVGPEHSWLKDSGRAVYVAVTDEEALKGFKMCTRLEGIFPALESAHAVWEAVRLAKTMPKEADIVVCLSGRGDKDIDLLSKVHLGKWANS